MTAQHESSGTQANAGAHASSPNLENSPYDVRSALSLIDFSSIENPFGTPNSFIEAISDAVKDGYVSYQPDRTGHELRSILSQTLSLSPDSFLVGSTPASMISAVAQTFEPCTVGISTPCPLEYVLAISSTGHDIEQISSPASMVTPNASILARSKISINAAVLANPSYPASRLLPKDVLTSYLDQCDWVIVDERSIELTLGGQSVAPFVQSYKNLIVIQTFTEQYATPGTPVSYCIAHPDTIAEIARFYDSTNVNMFAEVLASASGIEHLNLEDIRTFLYSEIPWMQTMLSLIPGIDIYPAEANYVMCSFNYDGALSLGVADINELASQLQHEGIIIKKLAGTPGLADHGYFCVAVRTRQENEALLTALRSIIVP